MWKYWQVFFSPEGEGGGGDVPADPPAADPPAADPPASTAADAPAEGGGQTPWYHLRINALTGKNKEAEERLAAAEAELARLRAQPAGTGLGEEEVERRAAAKAEQLAAQRAEQIAAGKLFESELLKIGNRGRKEFGATEFNGALTTIQSSLGDIPNAVLSACIEVENGHQIIFEMAKDLDKAAELMTIRDPTKLGVAIARFASELSGKKVPPPTGGKRVSSAPPPIEPKVGGGGTGGDALAGGSMADWVAAREAQLRARAGRR